MKIAMPGLIGNCSFKYSEIYNYIAKCWVIIWITVTLVSYISFQKYLDLFFHLVGSVKGAKKASKKLCL